MVRLQEGAWYSPVDESIGALDTYGCPNTLTLDIGASKLSQATCVSTCLVNVEKWQGDAPVPNGFTGPVEVAR